MEQEQDILKKIDSNTKFAMTQDVEDALKQQVKLSEDKEQILTETTDD